MGSKKRIDMSCPVLSVRPKDISELILPARKIEFESCKKLKTRSDSELSKKNGGIIHPKGIFSRNILGYFIWRIWGFSNIFQKKSVFTSFHLSLSSFLSRLLSSFSSCLFFSLSSSLALLSCLVLSSLLFSCLSSAVFSSLSVPVFFLCLSLSLSLSISVWCCGRVVVLCLCHVLWCVCGVVCGAVCVVWQ